MSKGKQKKKKQPSFVTGVPLGGKRAVAAIDPHVQKKPVAMEQTSWNDEHPSWRIARLEVLDGFGSWLEVSAPKLLDIRKQLGDFESMSWNEIAVQSKYFHHSIPIEDIVVAAQKRLDELGIYVDELFRFRLANLERIWGYRERGVLHLLWWDPKHEICPSIRR